MKNISDEDAYAIVFKDFCRVKKPSLDTRKNFQKRSQVFRFKKNEVILQAGKEPTHGYFIASGLVMCYMEKRSRKYVQWVRSIAGYFIALLSMRGKLYAKETVVALEDTVAIGICLDDLNWMQDNHTDFGFMISAMLMWQLEIPKRKSCNTELKHCPEIKYKNIQHALNFDLERIPDIYLASFLDITLDELREIRENKRSIL